MRLVLFADNRTRSLCGLAQSDPVDYDPVDFMEQLMPACVEKQSVPSPGCLRRRAGARAALR